MLVAACARPCCRQAHHPVTPAGRFWHCSSKRAAWPALARRRRRLQKARGGGTAGRGGRLASWLACCLPHVVCDSFQARYLNWTQAGPFCQGGQLSSARYLGSQLQAVAELKGAAPTQLTAAPVLAQQRLGWLAGWLVPDVLNEGCPASGQHSKVCRQLQGMIGCPDTGSCAAHPTAAAANPQAQPSGRRAAAFHVHERRCMRKRAADRSCKQRWRLASDNG